MLTDAKCKALLRLTVYGRRMGLGTFTFILLSLALAAFAAYAWHYMHS